ncbi:MAG TPA: DUF1844 domain-containing protein, partial [Blastocatellia bacterium]|nr:DUF1844 domain-containing protein [Blastocatellia bacterium]
DRRKFNADGSPREQSAESDPPQAEQAQADGQAASAEIPPGAEGPQGNVVSFPGESAKKKEPAASPLAPGITPAPAQQATPSQSDETAARDAQARAAASAAEQAYNQLKMGGAGKLPEASLLSLLDMLAGEAAMCLGMVKNPTGAEIPIDLDTARQVIDMLGMLQQKTRGNLNAEESDVLENILAYLRMQFVALSRSK